MSTEKTLVCRRCGKKGSDLNFEGKFRRCDRCQATACSKNCAQKYRKSHEKSCTGTFAIIEETKDFQRGGPVSPVVGQGHKENAPPGSHEKDVDEKDREPFHMLLRHQWLHGCSVEETFELLSLAFQFRLHDTYMIDGYIEGDSIYNMAVDQGRRAFERFLYTAEQVPGLMPEWWSLKMRRKLLDTACSPECDYSIAMTIDETDVGNPAELRLFAEQVYGYVPGHIDTTPLMILGLAYEIGGPSETKAARMASMVTELMERRKYKHQEPSSGESIRNFWDRESLFLPPWDNDQSLLPLSSQDFD
ncbi:hypothetical protein BDY21DRAFT_353991 [Lineolata rhizophorae]|uniref:Suppressor of anucleate metulae protein B n=1 Tax=Lineolata rhizophorae TaxID=578093 RepID=A0A6A6NS09_9PEZI|nr:hypothetical protein BDY21DRAFT_353991 [Lineolata rhizophorae]